VVEFDQMRSITLGDVVARHARRIPDQEAVVFDDRRFTYLQLNARANQLAHALRNLGIGYGDRVGFLLPNSNEIVEAYVACSKIGAIGVPINFRYVADEAVYALNDAGARVLIYDTLYNTIVEGARSKLTSVQQFVRVGAETGPESDSPYEALLKVESDVDPNIHVNEHDASVIMYTSGTTGKPKGAVLTQFGQFMNAVNFACAGVIFRRFLCIMPLFHQGALSQAFSVCFNGGTIIIQRSFDARKCLDMVVQEGISEMIGVPAMWNTLVHLDDINSYDLSSLRIGLTGGAIMPTRLKHQILETFPNMALGEGFGQTEMHAMVTYLSPQDSLRKTASVGRAMTHLEIRLVDDTDTDVAQGEIGEAIYRGPTVFKEYWNNPQATIEAMRNGWFHSGDLLRQDEEGFYYVIDRKKDVVITGGENVYSAEVEEVISKHPGVLEVAVIGVPHQKWGEAVMAVVVPRPGNLLTLDDITKWCAERIAGFKKPRVVDMVDALPRNATGKVVKSVLREKYGSAIRYDL